MSLSRSLQYAFIAIVTVSVGFSLYQWNASRASTQKTAPNNGLVGYWSFDEGTGTQAGDASGNNNTGTLTNGPTWTTGKLGQAVNFDGVNDYVTMGDQSLLEINNNSLSFGGWFYINSYPAANNRMFLITKGTTGSYEYELTVNEYNASTNKFTATVFTTTTASYIWVVSNIVPPLNTWFHVMGVWDKDAVSMKLYYNGVLENTSTTTNGAIHTTRTANFEIGRRNDNAEKSLNGRADEVRIYNRALSGTEITNLYNLGAEKLNAVDLKASPLNGLAGMWSFNTTDISGTTAYDRSGNANNGTLTNGPTAVSGRLAQGMFFDGVNDYMDAGTAASLKPTFPFSISLWVRRATAGESAVVTMGAPGTSGVYSAYTLTVGADLSAQIGSGGGCDCVPGCRYTMVSSSAPVTVGSWHHVVVIFTAIGNFRAIVDGVNVSMGYSGGGAGSMVYDAGSRFRINSSYACSTTSYNSSSVDDVRVYNRELSFVEAQNLYTFGAAKMNIAATPRADSSARLVGYWNLDDNTGTTATDSSGSGMNGTLTNGPTWGTGKTGSDVVFDGTDDYINLGTTSTAAFNFSGDVSAAAWVKTSTDGRMILDYQNGNPLIYMSVGPTSNGGTANKLVVYLRTNFGSFYSFSGEKTLTDGAWHHVAFSRDTVAQKVRLYVDGAMDGVFSYTDTTAINTSGGGHTISIAATYPFNGDIDDVRVYNRVLSSSEVKELSLLMPADTSLKGYWSFDGPATNWTSSSAGTVSDLSGNVNAGTLTNMSRATSSVSGKLGQGLKFDGVDDYVSIPTSSALNFAYNQDFSVTLWAKVPATQIDTGIVGNIILQKWSGGSSGYPFAIRLFNQTYGPVGDRGKVYALRYDATNLPMVVSGMKINDNTWHHISFTKNGSTLSLYIDGNSSVTTTTDTTTGTTTNAHPLFIGAENGVYFLTGSLDEPRVYNRALSAGEIQSLYNSGR